MRGVLGQVIKYESSIYSVEEFFLEQFFPDWGWWVVG
jgi:hypothetical protein